jgi:3'-phosphoadenosine 5'-phosphosulfate sulfotransferase (PAPS reductase)/FAD synthetase
MHGQILVDFPLCRFNGHMEARMLDSPDFDVRWLDKRSAHAGSLLSRLALECSPVVFECRFRAEDLVVLDLIGRYRFPVNVVVMDWVMPPAETEALVSLIRRRYVLSGWCLQSDLQRLEQLRQLPTDRTGDPVAGTLVGCRGFVSSDTLQPVIAPGELQSLRWDEELQRMQCHPLAGWSIAQVRAYAERWELPSEPVGAARLRPGRIAASRAA